MSHPEKIGKYEILAKIGEGGFGVVYKGRDPFIKRLVAVKTCTSQETGIQQRFFLEAEIAGNLHHDNVVTIHDFGLDQETPYLVQEYLEGEDLDLLIARGDEGLTIRNKVRCLRGVAEGLDYAHSRGVIHRDIKPSNIRVLDGGRVKVMDFGIAKLKDQESRLTATGMTIGTVAYLSPEQLQGETVDHRADVFSFGVVAYELLSGSRPFQGSSVSELFHQLLHEQPPPLDDSELPEGLAPIVYRCLAKNAEDRYGSLTEVVQALDEVRSQLPVDPDSTSPFWPGRGTSSSTSARLARLTAKAQRAVEEKDLTAAEMTLQIARRGLGEETFERELGPLARDIVRLKEELGRQAEETPPLDASGAARGAAVAFASKPVEGELDESDRSVVENALGQIRQELDAGNLDSAAIALVALEQRYPDLPQLPPLLAQMTRAHRAKRRPRVTSIPTSKLGFDPVSQPDGSLRAEEESSPRSGLGRAQTSTSLSLLRKLRDFPTWGWAAIVLGTVLAVLVLIWFL